MNSSFKERLNKLLTEIGFIDESKQTDEENANEIEDDKKLILVREDLISFQKVCVESKISLISRPYDYMLSISGNLHVHTFSALHYPFPKVCALSKISLISRPYN
mmetsp:Transcript_23383/g.29344  ORF Transcript_23383/g.29344 Transcript_23383/m.29344 type:complete len:105 (+) Transcript_23383:21-335(+)